MKQRPLGTGAAKGPHLPGQSLLHPPVDSFYHLVKAVGPAAAAFRRRLRAKQALPLFPSQLLPGDLLPRSIEHIRIPQSAQRLLLFQKQSCLLDLPGLPFHPEEILDPRRSGVFFFFQQGKSPAGKLPPQGFGSLPGAPIP